MMRQLQNVTFQLAAILGRQIIGGFLGGISQEQDFLVFYSDSEHAGAGVQTHIPYSKREQILIGE